MNDNVLLMVLYAVASAVLAVNAATDPEHGLVSGMFSVFGMAATVRQYRRWRRHP
jgi:hypothetical protein